MHLRSAPARQSALRLLFSRLTMRGSCRQRGATSWLGDGAGECVCGSVECAERSPGRQAANTHHRPDVSRADLPLHLRAVMEQQPACLGWRLHHARGVGSQAVGQRLPVGQGAVAVNRKVSRAVAFGMDRVLAACGAHCVVACCSGPGVESTAGADVGGGTLVDGGMRVCGGTSGCSTGGDTHGYERKT